MSDPDSLTHRESNSLRVWPLWHHKVPTRSIYFSYFWITDTLKTNYWLMYASSHSGADDWFKLHHFFVLNCHRYWLDDYCVNARPLTTHTNTLSSLVWRTWWVNQWHPLLVSEWQHDTNYTVSPRVRQSHKSCNSLKLSNSVNTRSQYYHGSSKSKTSSAYFFSLTCF